VLRGSYPRLQVVVCDNASDDDSLERLQAWARGDEAGPKPDPDDALASHFTPPLPKPIAHAVVTRAEAERGGIEACDDARVVLVHTGANLGFAGGCNVGLRYAMARGDCAFAWLLNNDTVVEPTALAALVARLAERPDAGQCGATVAYYHRPDRVQARGGAAYNRWLATTRRIGDGEPAGARANAARVERSMSYVDGASLFVRREFLDAVGLMSERYFLYFEELDWALRGADYELAYAPDAVVYHKEGRSIGSHADGRRTSALADYYALRNRLLLTRQFFPAALPTVYCGLLGAAVNRMRRGQFRRALTALRILLGTAPPPEPRPHAAARDAPTPDAVGVR
jgi:GT2 family glycosyltransferase